MDETTPTTVETTDSGYEEFEAAFAGDDGYQTDTAEQTDDTPQETDGGDDTTPGNPDSEDPGEEDPAGDDGGDVGEQNPPSEDTSFKLRVNKEDKVVTREEMFALAQKGMDYDRVKGQLTERDNTIAQMQQKLDGSQEAMELLQMISEETKMPIPQLLDQVHINMRMKKGETEAEARANIRAIKAERQIAAAQEKAKEQKPLQDNATAKAESDLAEFRKRFPDVALDEKLLEAMKPDVLKGMSLADAYQKQQLAQKDAEIAELKRQAAAAEQNRKNRAKSPGSQNDVGGKRTKSAEDDFFAAFEK